MLSRYCLAEHDATALRRPLVESGSLPALFMHTYDSTLAYPRDLFAEFEGKHAEGLTDGDVKYHNGFSSDLSTRGGPVHLSLAFNPSHLEIVNPVVEGSVRARQERRGDAEGKQVLPVLVHLSLIHI